MNRRWFASATVLGVLLITLFGFGAQRFYQSSPSQKLGYSADLNELRKRFNADKGKVRLLMLLSPTYGKSAARGSIVFAICFTMSVSLSDEEGSNSFARTTIPSFSSGKMAQ